MKVYHGIEGLKPLSYAVVTSGTFDGVHIGHRKILRRLREISETHQGKTVLLTFWPHPRLVLYPNEDAVRLINTFEEKEALLAEQGLDYLVKIPFTNAFSQMSSEAFIQHILVEKIGTKKLVIGYDHRFGKNRAGSFEHLVANASRYGFEVEEIPRQDVENVGVSSTKIRNALLEGKVAIGNEYLGSPFRLTGTVVRGNALGRKLGFPTANIQVDYPFKLIPADGVYAVEVKLEDTTYLGMLNIGFRPTVSGQHRTIEANLFDFDHDIYNKQVTVFFHAQIRREMKFDRLEDLQAQLAKDRAHAQRVLKG